MTPDADHSKSEHLTWAQWWARPWNFAHEDWIALGKPAAIGALLRTTGLLASPIAGITPCLPPTPHPTVLRLILASTAQLSTVLALIHSTFSPGAATSLSETHHLWCMRLSKVLPPDMLLSNDDPLQLLRTWVEPATWQRLRLRFPCARVLEIERTTTALDSAHSQLSTLWQAVVWRATAMTNDDTSPDSNGQGA